MPFLPKCLKALGAILALSASLTEAKTLSNKILILARDSYSAAQASNGLRGYGIPYESVLVPQTGFSLPQLNSTATDGNYGGIIIMSEVAYSYSSGWASAISTAQWTDIFNYQKAFGARMVRIDAYPTAEFGTTTAVAGAGCCDAGVEQLIKIKDASQFPTANIKTGAGVSTQGLWHYPASITNTTIATEIATFDPAGMFSGTTTAAVINKIDGREQMVWFMGWATDWSASCNFLQHSYIHWMTRGLFVGKRKVYLSAQVDDVGLETEIYKPAGNVFRLRTGDLNAHKSWQNNLNGRLPSGSSFFLEMGHNGNGAIIAATDLNSASCTPDYAVDYPYPPDTPLEFMKPLGTGTDLWDPEWTTYPWSLTCNKKDSLANWWTTTGNRDAFAHVSHTFTHEEMNNATYHDANLEMKFNQAWFAQMGISAASKWSPKGLIPPAITGLHNGDVIKAWMDNGINYVVGDNTRPVLRNPNNDYYARKTTVADNGYAGLYIVPRWATTIYYNCDTPDCTLQEWIDTSGGSGTFSSLLDNAKATNTRYLLGLHHDPYMFHQANMRNTDMPSFTVGSYSAKMSILQIWVETIAQEMTRLTNWPIKSLKHDDIAKDFIDRETLDNCNPQLKYNYSTDGTKITGATLTTNNNQCGVPVPVTFPGTVSGGAGTNDKVGSEPTIFWTTMSGSPVTFTLGAAITI